MPDRKPLRADLLTLLALTATVCIVIPGYVVAKSPDEFTMVAPEWLRTIAALLFAATFLGSALFYCLAAFIRLQRPARLAIWGLLAWVCTTGVAIPISQSVEMVAPSATPIAPVPFLIALALTGAVLWLVASGRRTIALIYLSVQMAVALVPVAPAIWDAYFARRPSTGPKFLTISKERNVLVVSFDDLSGALAGEALSRDPALRAELVDFTLFRNAVSNAPGTLLSLQNELFGGRDFTKISRTQSGLAAGLNRRELPLNDPRVDAMAYASYARLTTNPARRAEIGDLGGELDPASSVSNVLTLYDYVWVRVGTRFAVKVLSKLTAWNLNPLLLLPDLADPGCGGCDELARRLQNHKGPPWDRPSLNALRDFDALTSDLQAGDAPFSLRYMHFLFTHFPVDLDRHCQYRADSQQWSDTHQTADAATEETACALHKVGALVTQLKRLGVYDSTLLVVKSDHGKMASYFSTAPGNIGFGGSSSWGYDRYRPLLLLKPIGQRGNALMMSDRPVALSDLAVTLCRRMPGSRNCAAFPGVDILSPPNEDEPAIRLYVPKDAGSTHRYDDLRPVVLPRGSDLRALANP